jgi:hypothetical protein
MDAASANYQAAGGFAFMATVLGINILLFHKQRR